MRSPLPLPHALALALALVIVEVVVLPGCKRTVTPPAAHTCSRDAAGFPGIHVHGAWNDDFGCVWQSYELDGKRHPLFDAGLVLAREGWAAADGPARAALAQRYVSSVLLEPGALVDAAPPALADTVAPPAATAAPDGSVQFVGWRRLPAVLRPGVRYARLEATFRADGNLSGVRTTKTVNER
jgi:hypothetical protein